MKTKVRNFLMGISKIAIYTYIMGYSLGMAMAHDSDAQNKQMNQIAIRLHMTDGSMQSLIKDLEKSTGFHFAYTTADVKGKTISLTGEEWQMDELLQEISEQTRVSFLRVNETITIKAVRGKDTPVVSDKLDADQQLVSISGKVLDENQEPLPGATVLEKGTTNGTITDVDGKFTLKIPKTSILQVSFVGYKTYEVAVGNQATFDVAMEPDYESLDEVVIVGYGTTSKANFSGAVTKVNLEDSPLSNISRTDMMDALRGNVGGMTVSQQTGAGQAPSMLVRGQKSINTSDPTASIVAPLIVLDGVIFMGEYRDIDPNSIESVQVLKDAASMAAYGSRAANGVIMITTKRGKLGKPVVSFKSNLAILKAVNMPDLMGPQKYIERVNELEDMDPSGWMSTFEKENYANGKTTNWLDAVERTGASQIYSVGISGATEKMDYYLSGGYNRVAGVVEGDNYQKKTLTTRFNTNITDWLKIGTGLNYSFNDYSGTSMGSIWSAIRMSPYGSEYREGSKTLLEKYPVVQGTYKTNPLWDVKGGNIDDYDVYYTTILSNSLDLKCPWISGLNYHMDYSYTSEHIDRDNFTHEGYYVVQGDGDDRYSESTIQSYLASANGYNKQTKTTSWVWNNILSYQHSFGDHDFDVTYVYTRDYTYKVYKELDGNNFSDLGNTVLGYNGLAYAGNRTNYLTNTLKTDIGYLGRINYNYKGRYHVTLLTRRDGSSVFGADRKWGMFPSVSLGWTISNEGFFKALISNVDNLKIKASWGRNGAQGIDPYGTLTTLSLGQTGGYAYSFGNTSEVSWGQRVVTLGNTALAWTQTTSINGGFELSMFKSRLNLTANGYFSETTHQNYSQTIPSMANGITSMTASLGQVNNYGVELNLNTVNLKTDNLTYSTTVIFYLNRNKLVELDKSGEDYPASSLFIGKPLGAIYGYKNIGIVQESDQAYMDTYGAQAGDVKYLDKNHDGQLTSDDRTILGYSSQSFQMSLNNTLTYKNWEVYALFTGIFGGRKYYKEENYYAYATMTDVLTDNGYNHGWWTADNPSKKYPRINYTSGFYSPVQGRSFVRLQNVSISYNFREPWVQRMNIQSFKVFVSGSNLLTFSKWVGGDPETGTTLGTGYTYGLPIYATYSLGFNLTF